MNITVPSNVSTLTPSPQKSSLNLAVSPVIPVKKTTTQSVENKPLMEIGGKFFKEIIDKLEETLLNGIGGEGTKEAIDSKSAASAISETLKSIVLEKVGVFIKDVLKNQIQKGLSDISHEAELGVGSAALMALMSGKDITHAATDTKIAQEELNKFMLKLSNKVVDSLCDLKGPFISSLVDGIKSDDINKVISEKMLKSFTVKLATSVAEGIKTVALSTSQAIAQTAAGHSVIQATIATEKAAVHLTGEAMNAASHTAVGHIAGHTAGAVAKTATEIGGAIAHSSAVKASEVALGAALKGSLGMASFIGHTAPIHAVAVAIGAISSIPVLGPALAVTAVAGGAVAAGHFLANPHKLLQGKKQPSSSEQGIEMTPLAKPQATIT